MQDKEQRKKIRSQNKKTRNKKKMERKIITQKLGSYKQLKIRKNVMIVNILYEV